ncbi:unnamed protein product, partial [Laminaria digitata]
ICRDRYNLGDSVFVNGSRLLAPYDAPSTRVQKMFKFKHSQTRVVVEHALGRISWNFAYVEE